MTPDQSITLLLKSEQQARSLFRPEYLRDMLDNCGRLLTEAAILVKLAEGLRDADPTYSELAKSMQVVADLKLATVATQCIIAFGFCPSTQQAEYKDEGSQ